MADDGLVKTLRFLITVFKNLFRNVDIIRDIVTNSVIESENDCKIIENK